MTDIVLVFFTGNIKDLGKEFFLFGEVSALYGWYEYIRKR